MKKIGFLVLILFAYQALFSQLTISNGKHSMEISGVVTSYFNYRFLKDSVDGSVIEDKNKNRFKLRDAQIQIEGRVGNTYEYELQFDLADIASGAQSPANPGLMDAYMMYKGLSWFDVKLGYGKIGYSRSSLTPIIYSSYWQRAEIARGEFFGRRDVGLTLMKSLSKQRVNISMGVYNGLAENSLMGENDASGRFEYVGRVDFAYPSRYRYREIDEKISPIPMFALGLNGRYVNKVLPSGENFPALSQGEYATKLIDGQKMTYGLDFAFQYKGISFLFESHIMKMNPKDTLSYLYQGFNHEEVDNVVKSGGYLAQLSYYFKKQKTIVSARYQDLNISDLSAGRYNALDASIAYQVKGFNSMIKLQYSHILNEELIDSKKWTDQIRVGWQFLFR